VGVLWSPSDEIMFGSIAFLAGFRSWRAIVLQSVSPTSSKNFKGSGVFKGIVHFEIHF